MLLPAQAYDPQNPHEDVRALAGLDARSADVLRTLVEADSIRSAAAALSMHHSRLSAPAAATTAGFTLTAATAVFLLFYGAGCGCM
ncbi:hypothetical protein [Streptomyces rubrogriseus]|jgi:hypothetical protein|uniref:Uncharacterized protein n=1 Tax=Streptomyces rubrogriseus TaxID=194673 RepID=A0A6G3TJT2_9ACTN|nr:hypothetical protein [Streptomyces rubrogriseus]NEC36853.1 hypothetical protein [Streptomyces rubrogriseus]